MASGLHWVIFIFASLGGWFGIPALFRWRSSRDLARRARTRRAIVLTYDDGPGEVLTPRLVDLLKRRQVRATFFVIGRNAARHPETVRRLIADGHEIGNHTRDHLNAWKAGPLRAVRDIRHGMDGLADLGMDEAVFRPPFGKSTLATLLYCLLRGTRLAFWTHDSRDSWHRLPADQFLKQLRATQGGVVLMHDFDRPRRGQSPEQHPDYVLALTERIIDFAETHGFNFLAFSDLFDHPEVTAARGLV